jgi:hypothetical protein
MDYASFVFYLRANVLKTKVCWHRFFIWHEMIQKITEVPDTIAAFRASGTITREDFDNVIFPEVNELVKRTGSLNFLLVLDTPLKNFTVGAWWQDALLGISNLDKWHKGAIVTDSTGISVFAGMFSVVVPGEFKAFHHEDLGKAIDWVSI